MKIAVAMSGGVDSSVAALILEGQGHDVFGLTMRIWPCGEGEEVDPKVCCGPGAVADARRVASHLGIRHYVIDMRDIFRETIVDHFLSEYARGRTPNPCVRCNRLVKFEALLSKARAVGATHLATGHHAVIEASPDGGHALRAGRDRAKDQSYFLYALTQEQLASVVMPVGTLTKGEVRDRARSAGLHIAERPESQDVCFAPRGGIAGFLSERLPGAVRPGPIVDLEGSVLGRHRGVPLYTVGQRSGLGLARPRPTYVVRIDAETNTIVVGDDADLLATSLSACDLTWIAGRPPGADFRAAAQIRSAAPPAPAAVSLSDGEARVTFDAPQRAVAPGQAVVFYDGDRVLGGGTIVGRAVP